MRGAENPGSWAGSEFLENIPQTTRFLFLNALWRRLIDYPDWIVDAVENARAEGGTREDLRRLLQSTLYTIAFDFVYLLDEPDGTTHTTEPLSDVAPDEPRWALMEVSPEGEMTGREVAGLHESLMETAPGGEEAADDAGWF